MAEKTVPVPGSETDAKNVGAVYVDAAKAAEHGSVIVLAFFGPSIPIEGASQRVPLVSVAVPIELARQLPDLIRNAISANAAMQADATKRN